MALSGQRTFVGFGFGAIQAGLFLYEAYRSGNFGRMVVAEVLPEVVDAIRRGGGKYFLNTAQADRIEVSEIGPIEIEYPAAEADRARMIEALAVAEEIATAVPSVRHYVTSGPGSIHSLLAEGLRRKVATAGPRAIVYAAENHNHAAEILEGHVLECIPPPERDSVRTKVRFLNTVIGKMSGIVTDPDEIRQQHLTPITPGAPRAFLVEAFNRILISKIHFDDVAGEAPFRRGITVFEEKDDLLPFEEAKLYGHNATHALAAYIGAIRGVQRIAELRDHPDIFQFLRAAFLEESGEALIRKNLGVDRLFTPEGYREFADDLLARMVNPFLNDTVERVGRDPERKLGWDDRLIGTIRVALQQGVTPRRYAFGAAAALATLDHSYLQGSQPSAELLAPAWKQASPDAHEKEPVLKQIEDGRSWLRRWVNSGFQAEVLKSGK